MPRRVLQIFRLSKRIAQQSAQLIELNVSQVRQALLYQQINCLEQAS